MKILVRMTNWVGDCLIATPALRKLRELYPEAEVDVLVKKNLAVLFENNPYINRVILIQNSLIQKLKKENYARVYIFPRSWKSAIIAFLAGIPERIGYRNQGREILLTRSFKRKSKVLKKHQSGYYWNLISDGGEIPENEKKADFIIDPSIELWAKEQFQLKFAGKKIIGIAPGATYGSAKMWLPERFGQLSRELLKDSNLAVVFFGGPAEAGWVNKMAAKIPGAVSYAGKTHLQEFAALMKECDVVLTNDSGPMHIAAAVKVPLVVLFGPTNYENTAPMGKHRLIHKRVSCSPCLLRHCPIDHRCMKQIQTDEVYRELIETLEKTGQVHENSHCH